MTNPLSQLGHGLHPAMAEAMARDGGTVETNALLRQLIEMFNSTSSGLRQSAVDQAWSSIPFHVEEFGYNAAQAVNVPLLVGAQMSELVLIETIVATVPTGATGLIQLANKTIPVSAGTISLPGLRVLLHGADTRSLTISGASGPCALWLMGVMQTPTGTLSL